MRLFRNWTHQVEVDVAKSKARRRKKKLKWFLRSWNVFDVDLAKLKWSCRKLKRFAGTQNVCVIFFPLGPKLILFLASHRTSSLVCNPHNLKSFQVTMNQVQVQMNLSIHTYVCSARGEVCFPASPSKSFPSALTSFKFQRALFFKTLLNFGRWKSHWQRKPSKP